jgi:hypothetical protein
MWLKVKAEGIDIGDNVETTGGALERDLFIARVWGMYYVRRKGCILYRLRRGESNIPQLFTASNLRLLTEKATVRQGETNHPAPKWSGDRVGGLKL